MRQVLHDFSYWNSTVFNHGAIVPVTSLNVVNQLVASRALVFLYLCGKFASLVRMIQPDEVFKSMDPARRTETGAIPPIVWTVSADLPYLNGHFPNQPILPAIAIIDASTYLLQKVLERPGLKIACVSNAKFVSPIVPGQTIRIEFKDVNNGEWELDWKEHSSGKTLASLRVGSRT